MFRSCLRSLAPTIALLFMAAETFADDGIAALRRAYEHLQRGRYEEAAEAYETLAKADPKSAAAVLGLSRARLEQGEHAAGLAAVEAFLKIKGDDIDVLAREAELLFAVGRYADAEQAIAAALKIDAEHVAARLQQARLFVERGQIKEADEAFRWFVRYYNRKQPADAKTLLLVGEGSAEYARWHGVSDIFTFLVNTLSPDAAKADPLCWQAHFLSGSLLLEKYNRAQAVPDLKQALTINPHAVDVLVALGDAALQKHDLDDAETFLKQAIAAQPKSVRALQLQCDLHLTNGELSEGLKAVEAALIVNPAEQGTLARLAACYYLIDCRTTAVDRIEDIERRLSQLVDKIDNIAEVELKDPSRLEQLVMELGARNPRPGRFLSILGDRLSSRRKFAMAERILQKAIGVMPQLAEPKTSLGMLYMQTGRTDKAKLILDAAFKSDPYHVRVSNMRKVLGVLENYSLVTTDHFVIRADSKADHILAEYLAEHLEEIYGDLVKLYGFEPPTRTTFEIYNDAKGLSAHEWFSARMVGLPWIQTIGASTGMMVAMASPTAVDKPYNWARVVKHEFVHIVTLQQTGFNIPHWFTEALAVTSENIERPAIWNKLLLERVPAGKLWKLDELNHVFVRPESPLDWQFAYCQSRLYAQYMIEKFGEGTIAKLLDAYRRNVSTNDAIPQVFGVSVDEFDKGYREFLSRLVAEMDALSGESTKSLAELEKEHLAAPENTKAGAAYAQGLLKAKRTKQARELAENVLKQSAKEPQASVVIAELEVQNGHTQLAREILTNALNQEQPDSRVLGLLAKVELMEGEFATAAKLYELGIEKFRADRVALTESEEWLKGLAAAYIKLGEKEKLGQTLEKLARLDGEDATIRLKLAELAAAKDDYKAAKRWALEAIQIDVLDRDAHERLAEAYGKLGDNKRAERERRVLKELDKK